MKKLLSLLSVLTISGTAVPTTIAASPYQKEKENNQTNNLRETIKLYSNRNKRASGAECPAGNIIAPTLHIEWDDSQSYIGWIQAMTRYLINNDIIQNINNEIDVPFTVNQSTATYGLITSRSNINYFFVPVQLNNNSDLFLVFNYYNLYLQGFINNANTNPVYYILARGRNYRDDVIINVNFRNPNEENSEERFLRVEYLGVSGNYATLWPINRSLEFSQNLLTTSFQNLINHRVGNEINTASLARIIFITAEALRFNEIWQLIGNSIIFHNVYNENGQLTPRDLNEAAFDRAENNGQRFNYLNHWGDNSRDYLNLTDNQRINLRILNLFFLQSIRNKNQNNCLPNNRRSERSTENNKCYGKKFYYDEKITAEKLSNRLYEKYGEDYIAYMSYSGNSESY